MVNTSILQCMVDANLLLLLCQHPDHTMTTVSWLHNDHSIPITPWPQHPADWSHHDQQHPDHTMTTAFWSHHDHSILITPWPTACWSHHDHSKLITPWPQHPDHTTTTAPQLHHDHSTLITPWPQHPDTPWPQHSDHTMTTASWSHHDQQEHTALWTDSLLTQIKTISKATLWQLLTEWRTYGIPRVCWHHHELKQRCACVFFYQPRQLYSVEECIAC